MARVKSLFFWCLGLLAIGAAAYVGVGFMARSVAEMKLQEFLAGMQDVASAEYRDVEVSLLDLSAKVHDLHMTVVGGVEFDIGELELSRFEQLDGLPRSLAMSAKDVHIPLSQPSLMKNGSRLRELGYDVLALDYDLDFDYDPKNRWFRLHDLVLRVRHAGEIGVKLSLSNVDLNVLMEGKPEMAFMAIQRGELSYQDESLLGRILTSVATEEGTTPEEVRATLMEGLVMSEEQARSMGDEFSATAFQALREFLQDPEGIAIHAEPLDGVAVMQLMTLDDPIQALKALNMHVETFKK